MLGNAFRCDGIEVCPQFVSYRAMVRARFAKRSDMSQVCLGNGQRIGWRMIKRRSRMFSSHGRSFAPGLVNRKLVCKQSVPGKEPSF